MQIVLWESKATDMVMMISTMKGAFAILIHLLPVRASFGRRITARPPVASVGLHYTNPIMASYDPPLSCVSLVWPNPIIILGDGTSRKYQSPAKSTDCLG